MRPNEFITSDTHFGHKNIIKYSNRPFVDKWEMDKELIRRWNEKVPERGAIVYHLGDFMFGRSGRAHEILNQLNGTIRFMKGNHDKPLEGVWHRFDWARDYYESRTPDGVKVVMCHYPIASWNGMHRGAWQLHGHCHGTFPDTGVRRIDVGVDTHPNYEPYSYEELVEIMRDRGYVPVDHHGD